MSTFLQLSVNSRHIQFKCWFSSGRWWKTSDDLPQKTTSWTAVSGSVSYSVCDWCTLSGEWQSIQQSADMESPITWQVDLNGYSLLSQVKSLKILKDPCRILVRVFTKIFVRILARSLKCVYYFLKNLKEVFSVFSLVRDLWRPCRDSFRIL